MVEKKKLRLALIGTNGIPAKYGGAETFYENLTRELADRFDITVYCSKKQPRAEIGDSYLGAKLKYWNLSANGWQAVPYDILSIIHAAKHSDVLYIFGAGSMFFVVFLRMLGFKKKVYLNHGGLNEWEREKNSSILNKYSKRDRQISRNKVEHVVDNALYAESLRKTFGIQNANVIRYGGDQAIPVSVTPELLVKYPFLNEKYHVSVARAQVDNNLHVMLEAFVKMPDKKLVLVSNFKVSDYGKELFGKYQGYDNIVLIPGIYDKTELNAVRSNALAYIHSHSRCGTPPSLCEAMNLGLPIISFEMPVNHEVTQDNALFFSNAAELVEIVKNTTEDELTRMAKKSTYVARTELTWKHIGEQCAALFESNI